MSKIILASGSPRRKNLLRQIGLSFDVSTSNVSEDYDARLAPEKIVCKLATRKAQDVARSHPNSLVIGADTLVILEQKILEKPASKFQARDMLHTLSGTVHQVLTGVAFVRTTEKSTIEEQHTFFEQTEVKFGHADPAEIDAYIATGSPMDKAGAYGIQDPMAALFIESINGDFYNVMGFPLYTFYKNFKLFAPDLLPFR